MTRGIRQTKIFSWDGYARGAQRIGQALRVLLGALGAKLLVQHFIKNTIINSSQTDT